ncbi:MAG: SpoIIE family protein phosphatase [Treponema sp.]|nr:SpoIIE family protein phosphatase [Treponema sp.]
MTDLGAFVFVPLILTVLVSVILLFFAIRKSIKKDKSSINLILALLFLISGTVFSIVKIKEPETYFIFSSTILMTLIVLVSYFRYSESPTKTIVQSAQEINSEKEKEEEVKIPVFEDIENVKILDICKDYIIRAYEVFKEDSGLSRFLGYINTSLMENTGATGGAIMLVDNFDDVITVKAFSGEFPPPYKLPDDMPHKVARVETNFRFAQFSLEETIFSEVARSGIAELITNPHEDNRIFENGPEEFLKIGTYIISPLKVKDVVIGVTALARTPEKSAFGEEEFKVAQVLSDFASVIIKNVFLFQEILEHAEITKESDMACKIQDRMHSKKLPTIPSLSLGHMFNMAEDVCGDYFDILPSRKDRISFVVADVAGKGMNSLIIMIMIRAILRLIVNTTQSAATILSWVNRGVCADNSLDHFASLALINYDSTQKKIQFSTAGTTPILLFDSKNGKMRKLSKGSEPIGVEKATSYADYEMSLKSGDIIVTYTDGLVEALDSTGKQYTAQRLIDVVTKNYKMSGKDIAKAVKTDISSFSGQTHQHDDQTLLVIKIQ